MASLSTWFVLRRVQCSRAVVHGCSSDGSIDSSRTSGRHGAAAVRTGESNPTLAETLVVNKDRWGYTPEALYFIGLPEGTPTDPY